ncbi:MAG: EF-P beta-lysylation protein EpmB [Lamprocystis purpurea]|jgi:EF-P beta-lysylation protein EpmB|nr:EF-P beta-lysylation protein EpmB [Lamprocystis purpurea]
MKLELTLNAKPPMVTRSIAQCHSQDWRTELAQAFTRVPDLLAFLHLRADQIADLDPGPGPFRLLVPRGFAALMTPGDPQDPLLRQVLPRRDERLDCPGFSRDPVGDGPAVCVPGLLRKYAGRALLIAHGACAVHCRYCFRRHFPYAELGPHRARIAAAIDQIQTDHSLSEVILSGGDPLLLSDDALAALLARLAAIPHLRRLRLHTRLPTVLPARVTEALCALLTGLRLTPVLVVHVNHAAELGAGARAALRRLHAGGITLLNQSVLLRGVNDTADALGALSERLFDCAVLPYYLHQLDLVQGAAHFEVTDRDAGALMESLRARLPGYLVPRLVREVAGAPCKVPVAFRGSLTDPVRR